MDDMEIVRLKFTCCACYKTFEVESGGGTRYVHCPYCGEENRINAGAHAQYVHKAPAQQPVKEPTYPTAPIDSLLFFRDGDPSLDVKKAKKSSFQVGDDVILELDFVGVNSEDRGQNMMLPAKITKYELHGMSLFKGPHFELVFQPITDVPCIVVERNLQKNGDSCGITIIGWRNNSDAFSRVFSSVWIKKYHPAQYPKECRVAIEHNNNRNAYGIGL